MPPTAIVPALIAPAGETVNLATLLESCNCSRFAVALACPRRVNGATSVAGCISCAAVKEFARLNPGRVEVADGPVTVVPSTRASVAEVAGAVSATLLILVAVIAPIALIASTTFVPSQYRAMYLPLGTEIPVPPVVFRVTAKPPVVPFLMKYSLDLVGQTTLRAAPKVPVTFRNMARASSAEPLAVVNV